MTATMPVACVIGWPVKHSRSPVIHRFWLKELGLAGDYVLQPVETDDIAGFFHDLPKSRYVGCNVTVPHKEAAFAAVARREAAAEETGALNTIWIEDGRLVGTNTDPLGFLANLDAETPGWDAKPGPAIVLGAGGAARAIVWALLSRGFAPVTVVNRTPQRAAAFAARFGNRVIPAGFDKLPALVGKATLLVNTTTLGMHGQPPLRIDLSPLADTAVINDLIYVPMDTPLLIAARARGLRAVGGLGMLLHQAVTGFEHWFGQRPSVTPGLRAEVLKSIEAG
ncbi:shikimate dehydrogenase [soil metagenome]